MRQVEVTIRGRVQGVGYRLATASQAQKLGLAGWVRNLPDGGVEATFAGEDDRVEAMLEWCEQGPPLARVKSVALVFDGEVTGATNAEFVVRYT